jgi:hypothetical protein
VRVIQERSGVSSKESWLADFLESPFCPKLCPQSNLKKIKFRKSKVLHSFAM